MNNFRDLNYIFGTKLRISEECLHLNRHTWNAEGAIWEKSLIELFAGLVRRKRPGLVVDIGAQSGSFCLMAKFFPQTSWVAFEPSLENFHLLSGNLRLNVVTNVISLRAAVGNESGFRRLNVCRDHLGLNTLGNNVSRFDSSATISQNAPILKLDEVFNSDRVSLIKIDTEGGELDIIQGALKIIRRDRPIILLEYNERNLSQFEYAINDLDVLIKSIGYAVVWQGLDDILIFPTT